MFWNTKLALILLLTIFPFGQLLRVNVLPDVTVHLNDLVVGVIGVIGIIREVRAKRKLPLFWPVLLWTGAMVASLLVNAFRYNPRELFIGSLYAVRWVAYAGLFLYLQQEKITKKGFIRNGLAIVALVVALAGIVQYLVLPDVSFLAAQNWDEHYFRLISTFLDPGFTGIILVLGLVLIFNFQFLIFKQFSIIQLLVVYTAMLLTYSRASYLVYLVGFAVISYYKRSLRIIALATLILVLTIPLLPKTFGEGTKLGRENSVWARINNWKQSVAIWRQSPIFGVGFNTYRYATGASLDSHAGAGADSSLLFVLATTGVVGLIAYLGVLRGMWVMGKSSTLFKASLAVVFIHSWFNNTLFYPWVMEWLWILLAVL